MREENSELVSLFHSTEYDKLEKIDEEGIKTRYAQGDMHGFNENMVKNQVVYLYHPEELPNYIKEDFSDIFVECSIPKEELKVTKFGCKSVEYMDIDQYLSKGYDFEDYEEGNISYSEHMPLMFLYPDNIPRDSLNALKWSI